MELGISYMFMPIIDSAAAGKSHSFIQASTVCLLFLITAIVLKYIYSYTRAAYVEKGSYNYRKTFLELLMSKNAGEFRKENQNQYISMLTNDVQSMQDNYYMWLPASIQSVVICVAALILMIKTNFIMTLVAVLLALFPVVAGILTGNKLAVTEKEISENNAEFLSSVKDFLTGFLTVKIFKIEDHAKEEFLRKNSALYNSKYNKEKISMQVQMLSETAGNFSLIGTVIIGSFMVIKGIPGTSIGMIIFFAQMMNYMIQPITLVVKITNSYKAKESLIEKAAAILEKGQNNDKDEKSQFPSDFHKGILLKDMSFSYNGSSCVLSDINFTFEPGKKYAIVGASGSGKTTLLNILMGSYSDYKGHICVDNVELKNISHDSLYEYSTEVQQDVFLFNDSIINNIVLYRDFPEDKVQKAIIGAGLCSLIKEKGKDFYVGENGKNLSGGEKQRISIARSLLCDVKVMFLDEITSHLDVKTADHVLNTILNLDDITRIVITHQLNHEILNKFDEILVLKNGKIIESGTYESLMMRKEYFYSLVMVES